MRTSKLTLLALAAIAALATSCGNDELGDNNNQKGIVIKATAGTPQGGADTRLTHTVGSTGMDIVWAIGDAFTVYSSSQKHNYTLTDGGGTTSASFDNTSDPWSVAPTGNVYAIYPTNNATSRGAITLSLEGQTGAIDGLKNFNYMTASTTYSADNLNFGSFTHQVAIVKLVLTFPDDVTGTEATEVGLKAKELNKSTMLNLITGRTSYPELGDVTTGANTVAITSKQLTAYLCVFGGALTDAKAIAKVGNDNYEADLSDLTIVAGRMYTATVTLTKQEAANDYIEVNGLKWAVGNLVAKADNSGCKIGAPTDGGLYFQFGSLIGWNGGATGDGTGTAVNGLTLRIKVKPAGCTVTSWDDYWTGNPAADAPATGTGDPCRYYLGGTWRLPTTDEYKTLFNDVADSSYDNSGGWSWDDTSESAIHSTDLTFPASSFRDGNEGSLDDVGENGYYWSASSSDNSLGFHLRFHNSGVYPNNQIGRTIGGTVRCVRP